MEDHLDWHFRTNRRAKDASRRALSRGWYHTVSGWMAENDPLESIVPDDISMQDSMIEVNIPADEEENAKCGTCLEPLFKFYDEKQEEWMLKNAIKENDQVFFLIFEPSFIILIVLETDQVRLQFWERERILNKIFEKDFFEWHPPKNT